MRGNFFIEVLIEPVGQKYLKCYVELSFLFVEVYFEFFRPFFETSCLSVEQEPLLLVASNPAIDFDASSASRTIECPVSAWEHFLCQRNFSESFLLDLLS